VKGLIFNLLDSMARESGCSDEAWDLVMEFVASETEHYAQSDTCLACFDHGDALGDFETPAEAMIQCLGNGATGPGESLSEFPEMAMSSELEEWAASDSIPALMDPDFRPGPKMAFAEGFSHDLLSLLEQLLAEALSGSAESDEDLDAEEHPLLSLNPSRRSS
jgi:hypothetical protein